MAKLWFQNSNGKRYLIAEVADYQQAFKEIHKFIDECNQKWPEKEPFQVYYIRSWHEDGYTKLDVGSWSEFFYTDLPYEVLT